jgi:hypothetical protein
MSAIEFTAGRADADFCGCDNRAIQAAVAAAAQRGGGTVRVLPGVYVLEDSVHLRDGIGLVGAGRQTILRKAPERYSKLSAYLGYGHYDVSLADPDQFAVGMGVTIRDNHAVGFYETVATLIWRDGDRFGIDLMLNHDYSGDNGSEIYTSFAPVSATFAHDVEVRDLVIEGNRQANPHFLNGCRGGGVFLLAVKNATVAGVTVRDLNGDAIGFQQCTHVRIEGCALEDNAGHGLHPGSGSVGGAIRRCTCARNGRDGVFFCLRAAHCICEACSFIGNGDHGVSIGDRDGNNAIIECRVEDNRAAGVFLRECDDEGMAPHATLIARNAIADNCVCRDDAEILIQSAVRDLHMLDNSIARRAGSRQVFGIRIGERVIGAHICGNRFDGQFIEQVKVECDRAAVSFERPRIALPVGPEWAPPDADRHLPPSVRG